MIGHRRTTTAPVRELPRPPTNTTAGPYFGHLTSGLEPKIKAERQRDKAWLGYSGPEK